MAHLRRVKRRGHYTLATQISKNNVENLEFGWKHRSGDYVSGLQSLTEDITAESMKTRPAVVQATKIGMTFVLDRGNRLATTPVEERPVPQVGAIPGEY